MKEYAVQTENLTRDFGPLRAIDALTVEVPKGTIFGFLGPNGSGKTTTIRLLLGLLEPSAGKAEVMGFDIRTQGEEIRRVTGALLEYSGLYERLSAEDNLEFFARIARLPARQRRARIEELLRGIGLWDRRQEPIGQWSRGMRQKLAAARAMLHRPRLIFLDEPSAGLDPTAAAALREDIVNMSQREEVTVFLTTHNLAEAEKICTQVAVIRAGRLLVVGEPEKLRTLGKGEERLEIHGRGLSPDVFERMRTFSGVVDGKYENGCIELRVDGSLDSAHLVGWLVGKGVEVEQVSRQRASLEDVFLALVQESEERASANAEVRE